MQTYVHEVMTQSKPLLEKFLTEKQVRFWPSVSNYLWLFPADAKAVDKALQSENILVRPKADGQGQLGLRVTLGTLAQTRRLIQILERVL